jgi:DNA-binding LacI/PurR family transcriptional regulator
MSAIADVARLAGVSKATASRALSGHGYVSEETRQRVRAAADELGYVASTSASSLVTGRSHSVGVLIPAINRWYFAEVLEGIEGALIEAGYDMTLYRVMDAGAARERVFDYFLARKGFDAVISVGIALTRHELDRLRALGRPVVSVSAAMEGIPTVGIDDFAASEFITEHLVSLGHTRIMHLGGEFDEQPDCLVHAHRLAGMRDAMERAGLGGGDDFRSVPYTIPGAHAGALTLLADPASHPTAIVAGCDEIAIGVILAARQLGILVPSQLSVVGIDGHALAPMFGLTTLEQHPAAQGATAVALALSDAPAGHVTAPVDFTVRRTTRAPREA